MSTFEVWMTGFVGAKEVFTTAKQKEDAEQAFADFKRFEVKEARFSLEHLKEMCIRIDSYVSHARPRHGINKDQTLILDPFFAKLLDFIMCLVSYAPEMHEFLRDELNFLASLTNFLGDKYQREDQKKLLLTIEVLTQGIVVSWSVPHLTTLIKQIFGIIVATNTTTDTSLHCLRIVTNLVFNNQNCLNIVLRETIYRDVLKRLLSILTKRESIPELTAMAINFCYITDNSLSIKLSTQIDNIKDTFTEILQRVESEKFEDVQGIATTIYYVSICISTILYRGVQDKEESFYAEAGEDANDNDTSAVKKIVNEISQVVLSKFFTRLFPLLRTEKGQVIVYALMNLMKALCPNTVPAEEYANLWESFANSLNELSMVASSSSKAQLIVLGTHMHFVDRILKSPGRNLLSADAFKYALNHCQLVISSHPVDLNRNILTIRLLSKLNALATAPQGRSDANNSVVNKVSKLLSEEALFNLLSDLLSEKTDDLKSVAPCIQLSTCVVEVLIKLASKRAPSIIESLDKEKTWFHISNCIVNGNEELINQALALMGTVVISTKCREGVSKTLMEMRESFSSYKKILPKSPEKPAFPSFAAQVGMKKLNDHLEMFEKNHTQTTDPAIDDILAWYKLKNDLHEMELNNNNEQIFHLNQTITQLKTLLNKQTELITKRAVSSDTMRNNFNALQRQLEVTKQKKVDLEMKHLKAVQSLRQQLTYQEGLYKSKCENLAVLERDFEQSKLLCAELMKGRDEANATNRQLTQEKRKLQDRLDEVEKDFKTSKQRLSVVEADLKKSEEGRKAAEALLEAERRKTEIIQQVLGNRLN